MLKAQKSKFKPVVSRTKLPQKRQIPRKVSAIASRGYSNSKEKLDF